MTNQERLQANNAKIEAIQQTLANKVVTSGEIELTENNKTYDVSKYASAKTNIAVPDLSETTATEQDVVSGKVFYNASGEKVAGTYKDMLQARVDAKNSCSYLLYYYLGDNVDFLKQLNTTNVTNMSRMFAGDRYITTVPMMNTSNVTDMSYMFYDCHKLETVPLFDTSNVTDMSNMFNASSTSWAVNIPEIPHFNTSKVTTMAYMFFNNDNLTTIPLLDTSSVTNMNGMFAGCANLTTIPLLDTSSVTNMNEIFYNCHALNSIPLLDTSSVEYMQRIFYTCRNVTEIPPLDTKKCTNFSQAFYNCNNLETIHLLDFRSNTTAFTQTFLNCKKLTNLTIKNIKSTLQIGSGTSYGHLLTLESLLNTIKELHTNTSTSTRTLTVGSANLEKLANVYVKLIDITEEMRAEDEYIDNKAPFVVCESTDDGAMLITEYVTSVKKWQLA